MLNKDSLDTLCAALAYAFGIEPPEQAADRNQTLSKFIDTCFGGERADRIVMYNPDAVAQWIYEKYPQLTSQVRNRADIEIPMYTVMPSVTPVCFGTMYTGAQPEVHGIRKYEKPIIRIDTLFDALIRAGKRIAIVTYGKCSLSRIFLERELDYFHFEDGGIEEVNAKAAKLILEDKHDLIVIYNGNYDTFMHKFGPESIEALAELRINDHIYGMLCDLIERHWSGHNTLLGFAMDHGCHEIDDGGAHGLDMEEDLNIVHLYKAIPKK